MLVPTFTDELRAREGAAPRIVTMSIKARSAITLAGHSANVVTWFGDTDAWATSAAYFGTRAGHKPGPAPSPPGHRTGGA